MQARGLGIRARGLCELDGARGLIDARGRWRDSVLEGSTVEFSTQSCGVWAVVLTEAVYRNCALADVVRGVGRVRGDGVA